MKEKTEGLNTVHLIHKMQLAMEAIKEVCDLHEVVLIGSCTSEGIYGEIVIAPNNLQRYKEAELGFNRLYHCANAFFSDEVFVNAIGELK